VVVVAASASLKDNAGMEGDAMSTTSNRPATPVEIPLPASIPRLESGDELSRDEFERRYQAMPDVKKAELIEGIVYMPSPVRYDQHGLPHAQLMGLLTAYYFETPGVLCCDNSTVRLDLINEPQPDAVLFIEPSRGGTVRLVDGYIEGGPDLVAEVSATTVSIDLKAKLRAYHRNQVREYLVWRVKELAIDWFVLRGSEYVRLEADAAGVLKSTVFPGLWLDAPALLSGDLPKFVACLRAGLANESHATFVASLARRG
jgi:Uma2 family endonuclease